MKEHSYRISLVPAKWPENDWARVLAVRDWWAQDTEGDPKKRGDSFTVRFGTTFGTFCVTELNDDRMVWEVRDSYLDLLKDPMEWSGTRLIFERSEVLRVMHDGLTPEKECFRDCEQGWNFFLGESLLNYLETGKGSPAIGIHTWLEVDGEIKRGTLYSPGQLPETRDAAMLLIDVKATQGEKVINSYKVCRYEDFDGKLSGRFFALFNDEPGLLDKLEQIYG